MLSNNTDTVCGLECLFMMVHGLSIKSIVILLKQYTVVYKCSRLTSNKDKEAIMCIDSAPKLTVGK